MLNNIADSTSNQVENMRKANSLGMSDDGGSTYSPMTKKQGGSNIMHMSGEFELNEEI